MQLARLVDSTSAAQAVASGEHPLHVSQGAVSSSAVQYKPAGALIVHDRLSDAAKCCYVRAKCPSYDLITLSKCRLGYRRK